MHFSEYQSALQRYSDLISVIQNDTHLWTTLQKCVQHLRQSPLIFLGVGKSHWIAKRASETSRSLNIPSMAPRVEDLLHGGLSLVQTTDTALILISKSGETPELLSVLAHIPPITPIIYITCNTSLESNDSATNHFYLSYPGHLYEQDVYGFVPLTSLVGATILCDLLLMFIAQENQFVYDQFLVSHPGGYIGQIPSDGVEKMAVFSFEKDV